ncbi:unnamed protein product, partial [Effrenium voratum]
MPTARRTLGALAAVTAPFAWTALAPFGASSARRVRCREARARGARRALPEDLAALFRSRAAAVEALEAAEWREASGVRKPSARLWPSVTPVGGSKLAVFGGLNATNRRMLDELWLLEEKHDGWAWTPVQPVGRVPPGRAHHDAAQVGRWLVIHGGLLENGCRSDDTWRVDLAAEPPQWQALGTSALTPDRPIPRYHHSFLSGSAGVVALFGGHDFARRALDDLWLLEAGAEANPDLIGWQEVEVYPRPAPRAYHAAAWVDEGMFLCGGELQDGSCCCEMWLFDLERLGWRRSTRDLAEGRQRHALCAAGGGVVALAGGRGNKAGDARPVDVALLQLKVEEGKVSCVELQAPDASTEVRQEAELLRLDSGHLVLFGGNEGQLVDQFGDGYHQLGLGGTLLAELPPGGASCAWRRPGGPLGLALGAAVAKLLGQVVVLDWDRRTAEVRVNVLRLTRETASDAQRKGERCA